MVKPRHYIIFFLFYFSLFFADSSAAPLVDASIDQMSAQAHYPLQGIITITHQKEEKIDPDTIQMEGKKLAVSHQRDVLMSAASDTLLSIYNFELPGRDQGLYALPEISVQIDHHVYHSTPSAFEVVGGVPTPHPSSKPSAGETSPLIFRLDTALKGPGTLYPGERTQFYYRISYNRSIDLTKSELPMIHPSHFQKVGDVHIHDTQEQEITVQELTQEVEASETGTFSFGPSLIEGYAYTMKGGQKIYDNTLLQAQAPAVTVEVKAFPAHTQPASFTGALGSIEAEWLLESQNTLSVGDTLQLVLKVRGVTNLTELHLPLLECQPGFSGFFQTSDLPPPAEVQGETKFFHLELRPITPLSPHIPSLELSLIRPHDPPLCHNAYPTHTHHSQQAPFKKRTSSTNSFTVTYFNRWEMAPYFCLAITMGNRTSLIEQCEGSFFTDTIRIFLADSV